MSGASGSADWGDRLGSTGWSATRDWSVPAADRSTTRPLRAAGASGPPVAPADLVRARRLLARNGVQVSAVGSAGLAGLLAEAARGRPVIGRHIAVVTG